MADAFRDLIAWQKAMAFVTDVYRVTESFPQREIYGLTNQLRRAAVSVASNIAEGKGRLSKKNSCSFSRRRVVHCSRLRRNLKSRAICDFLAMPHSKTSNEKPRKSAASSTA